MKKNTIKKIENERENARLNRSRSQLQKGSSLLAIFILHFIKSVQSLQSLFSDLSIYPQEIS